MATAQVRSDVLAPAVLRTASAAGFAPHCTQTNIAEFYQLTFKEECEKSLPFLSLAAVSREPFKTAAKEKNKSANVRSGLGLTNVGPRARRQGTILVPPPWRGNVARSGPPKIAPLTPAPRGPVACTAKAKTARGTKTNLLPKGISHGLQARIRDPGRLEEPGKRHRAGNLRTEPRCPGASSEGA